MSGGQPIVFLVARREILIRLHSRVFKVGTIAMIGLVAVGIVAVTALTGPSSPAATYRVGFTSSTTTLELAPPSNEKHMAPGASIRLPRTRIAPR